MNILKPIKAPKLTFADYGSRINEVFENIDSNFTKLSNHDYIKGDKGNSLYIKTVELSNHFDIVDQLKDAVSRLFVNTPKNIGGKGVFDWFDVENPGKISLIYEEVDGLEVLVSSLPYTFKDLRFHNIVENNIDEYDDEVDYSCIINYDQGRFEAVQLLPTIYFDNNLSTFCWIINGIKTGLEAQGPRGFEGKAGVFKTVVVKNDDESDVYKVSLILDKGTWVDVINTDIEGDHATVCSVYDLTDGTPVLAIVEGGKLDENGTPRENIVYISEVYKDTAITTGQNQLLVICSDVNRLYDISPIEGVKEICEAYWASQE